PVITSETQKTPNFCDGRGCFQFSTSWTLLGSTAMPSAERTWPKKAISLSQKAHLLNLAYNLCSRSLDKTIRRCSACSASSFEYTKISSMNTTTNLSNSFMNTKFIMYMKNAGALVRLKDMTRY